MNVTLFSKRKSDPALSILDTSPTPLKSYGGAWLEESRAILASLLVYM
jgi:hypothetical protein